MAILNQTMLAQLVRERAGRGPLLTGNNYTITKKCVFCGSLINIINFGKGQKYVVEAAQRNSCYINMGSYLLSVRSERNFLSFTDVMVYDTASGNTSGPQNLNMKNCRLGRILVLDGKILAVCAEGIPRFFVVIGKNLEELPAATVESALLQTPYTEKQWESFFRFYPDNEWEMHNGLVLNPKTKAVPGALHFRMWLNGRKNVKAKMRKPLDIALLATVFTRSDNEYSCIKYINTQQF